MALTETDVGLYHSGPTHGKTAFTTGSFTPPASSLLVVIVYALIDATGNIGQPTISGGSLTWTYVGQARLETSWADRMSVFTAPVGASPSSMTVVVDDDTNQTVSIWQVAVFAFEGYDVSTPIAGFVTSNTTDVGDGAETQTLTATPATDDITISAVNTQANSAVSASFDTGWSVIFGWGTANYSYLTVATRPNSTSDSVACTDTRPGTGTFYYASMLSFIVKAAVAATGQPTSVRSFGVPTRHGMDRPGRWN